jgi:uncharacterized protein (TIRG00374 family)
MMKSTALPWLRQPIWLMAIWLGALAVLAWSMGRIPVRDVFQALDQLQLGSTLILVLLNIAMVLLISSRWWLILRAQGQRINLLRLVGYRLAAFSMSYFTPGPQFGGEPLQVHLLTRHGIPVSTALSSVSLDKLLELAINFTFLVGGVMLVLQTGLLGGLASSHVLALALSLVLVPVSYLAALWGGKRPLTGLLIHISHPRLQAATRLVEEAETLAGQFCRQKPVALLAAVVISLLTWAVMILEYYLLLNFLGLSVTLAQAIAGLTAARLAFLAPTPAGLGALEASQALASEALGFGLVSGLTVSLVIRARDLLIGATGLSLTALFLKKSSFRPHIHLPLEEE